MEFERILVRITSQALFLERIRNEAHNSTDQITLT